MKYIFIETKTGKIYSKIPTDWNEEKYKKWKSGQIKRNAGIVFEDDLSHKVLYSNQIRKIWMEEI